MTRKFIELHLTIAHALDTVMPVHFAENMESAVHMAAGCAESDDTVLLVASAPQYGHGVIDPVAEIGPMAEFSIRQTSTMESTTSPRL